MSLPPELNGDYVQVNQVSPSITKLTEKCGCRLWFGENRANRIGMYDTKAGGFQEWVAPSAEQWPYDVTADKNSDAWAGGEFSNRVLRLNPKSGEIVEYLLPKFTNIRRVFVDNSTTPPTFWVGNNRGASIVKLEPFD